MRAHSLPSALALLGATLLTQPAAAQPMVVTTPHTTTEAGPVSMAFEGRTFVNQGLVAVGRLPAHTRSWRRLPGGSYQGRIFTLPDRGPNSVGAVKGTTDYRNRVEVLTITLAPKGATPGLTLRPTGGFFLRDAIGRPFTGQDPVAGALTRDGVLYPSPAAGDGAGRISLDPEAMAMLPDGSSTISTRAANRSAPSRR
jgi:hypothetical protein